MATAAHSRLSTAQVDQFGTDGYTLFRQPVYSPERFAKLKAIFEENLAKYGEDDLDTIHFRDERLFEFLFADEVLDLVEPLIGPNIGLWSSHFICKPAKTGKATPWHEDSAYWNGRISTMEGVVTIWLAIDPVFPENGAMAVVPGTHTGGFSEYTAVDEGENVFSSGIAEVDESKAVTFTLDPNECSLHEARIIHGAKANTSDHRRCGYTMRYFPTTSKVLPIERNAGHKIWLARGEDVAGNPFENA